MHIFDAYGCRLVWWHGGYLMLNYTMLLFTPMQGQTRIKKKQEQNTVTHILLYCLRAFLTLPVVFDPRTEKTPWSESSVNYSTRIYCENGIGARHEPQGHRMVQRTSKTERAQQGRLERILGPSWKPRWAEQNAAPWTNWNITRVSRPALACHCFQLDRRRRSRGRGHEIMRSAYYAYAPGSNVRILVWLYGNSLCFMGPKGKDRCLEG